jgi:hypothetical protein
MEYMAINTVGVSLNGYMCHENMSKVKNIDAVKFIPGLIKMSAFDWSMTHANKYKEIDHYYEVTSLKQHEKRKFRVALINKCNTHGIYGHQYSRKITRTFTA